MSRIRSPSCESLNSYQDFVEKAGIYLTRNRKLKLTPVISRRAVISSEMAAKIADIKHTLLHNKYRYTFQLDDYFKLAHNEPNAYVFLTKLVKGRKTDI